MVDDSDRVVGMVSRSDVVRLLASPDRTLEARVDAELTAVGLSDWLVEAHDGSVRLVGPETSAGPDRRQVDREPGAGRRQVQLA